MKKLCVKANALESCEFLASLTTAQVEVLDLRENKLIAFDVATVARFASLKHLYLSKNAIGTLLKEVYVTWPATLTQLYLDRNKLSGVLARGTFVGLPHLELLDLS